MFVLDRSSKK